MKRSAKIGLSAAGLLMVAGGWSILGPKDEALVYDDTATCRADGKLTGAQCEQRFEEARAAHVQDARKFPISRLWECEAEYGSGSCETRTWNGAQVVVPALVGMVVARSLFGAGRSAPLLPPTRQACPPGSPREECQPRRSSSSTGTGGGGGSRSSGSRAYTTTSGQAVVATGGTTRANVTSRGGFGSTGHAFGSSSS